jgi:septal ring-binding cell division protein DamX
MGNLPQAAQQWKQQLQSQMGKVTIQLLIACQEKTVLDAFQTLEYSREIAIVPIDFQGRPCYRVLYGTYSAPSQAQSARADLPQEFFRQASPPQVVPLARILQ